MFHPNHFSPFSPASNNDTDRYLFRGKYFQIAPDEMKGSSHQ